MTPLSHSAPPGGDPRGMRALIAAVAVPVILAIALLTFAWPAARVEPRDLPLGVAGTAQATQPIVDRLSQQGGAFEIHRYADEAGARAAIEDREVYGAVVASPGGTTVLTASAASPLVAGMLEHASSTLASGTPAAATPGVTDVVPADPQDPRGAAFASLVLPLVLASVIAGVMVSILGRAPSVQALALLGAAVTVGLVGVGMMQGWLGVLGGDAWLNAGVLGLTLLAVAATLAGLNALVGHAGLALGAVLMVLVGNPWSGVANAPEVLPEAAGVTGQLLPPGAGGNLLRSTSFFDGAGSAGHLVVLLAWMSFGFAAMWAGALVTRRRRQAAPQASPLAT